MSKRSALLAFAIVVVAGGAGWWLLHRGSEAMVAPTTARSTPARAESPANGPPVPAPATASPDASAPPPSAGASRTPLRAPTPAKEPEQEEEKAKTIGIDGLVVVVDSRGGEHREESGTLRPKFVEPPRDGASDARFKDLRIASIGNEVSVASGRFHLELPPGTSLGVDTLLLGGRPALFEGEPIEIVAGVPATIRVRWIDGITLHVVDATAQTELDDVTVARPREQIFISTDHPGAAESLETVADRCTSPLLIAPRTRDARIEMLDTVFIRAAGRAWKRVELDFRQSTETTVELIPGATLVVELRGELPHRAPPPPTLKEVAGQLFGGGSHRSRPQEEPAKLRVRARSETPDLDTAVKEALDHFDEAKPEDFPGGRKPTIEEFKRVIEMSRGWYEASREIGPLRLEQPAVLGETTLESLVPGEFVVSVELGDKSETPLVAGKADAKLVAGATTRVSLVVAPIAAQGRVPLAGTLFIPAGWNTERLELRIEPIDLRGKSDSDQHRVSIDQMVALPGRPGWYHWNAGEVPPATWRFDVRGAALAHVERVDPPGNDHVELRLHEPATLIVHVVDETSGQPVELRWLEFTSTDGELVYGLSSSIDLEYDRKRTGYVATVPIGAGAFESYLDDEWTLDSTASQIDVHPGEQEITLRAHRLCGFRLALVCAGAPIPWPRELVFECKVDAAERHGRMLGMTLRDDLPAVSVTAPGRYRVTPPPIPGYEPVEPFEVDVPSGEFVTKTIELKRK